MNSLLSIVWYKIFPPVFGGQKGIADFNNQLSKHHPLVCLCSKNNEPADDVSFTVLPQLPTSKAQFFNPFVWSKITELTKKEKPSFLIIEHPYHGIAAFKARKKTGVKVIVHSHNIESERFRELGKPWWQLLRNYEKWVHRKADINIFKTQKDLDFAILKFGINANNCVIVPYGIEKPVINDQARSLLEKRHHFSSDNKIFLFAGTLDYEPNAIAVRNIFQSIVPILEKQNIGFRVIICGRNRREAYNYLENFSHPSVIMAGEVPDIENYFQAADAFINPVQSGGGIQTKNIEALGHHCTVICFENMAEGLSKEVCGNKLLTIENGNWTAFVMNALNATKHKEKTPEAFFTYFGWENCIRPLLDKLKIL